ncbi:MAG TPA: hypothetical protein VNU68_00380 [Verrucomicrobiae bacterium]|nr:hypothetical protein [Verrucomicrobiae bacterium]
MFEILAANETALVDSDGDVSDWIEIHNPTTTTTALTGWYLSDDPDFLRKWKFPLWNIPVGAYRVVFASGKNRTNGVELHAILRWRLHGEGEPFLCFDA